MPARSVNPVKRSPCEQMPGDVQVRGVTLSRSAKFDSASNTSHPAPSACALVKLAQGMAQQLARGFGAKHLRAGYFAAWSVFLKKSNKLTKYSYLLFTLLFIHVQSLGF